MMIDSVRMNMSMNFCFGVSALAFKWKRAGKVKAIGVHVTDPRMAKNLSSLSPSKIVIITTKQTTTVLEIFLNLCLFLDFSHPSNKIFSKMILTG